MDVSTLLMVAVVLVAGYFLMIRPAQRRQSQQQQTVSAIQPGTRVMTTAGVFGNVRHIGQKQAVIEIAPGVEMTVLKQAISRVVKPEDDEFEYEDEDAGAVEGSDLPVADVASSAAPQDDDAFGQAIAGFHAPDAADPQAPRQPESEDPEQPGPPHDDKQQ